MKKPKALDLFCKAGGATKGLQEAGFHVTGVDIEPQPRYCGDVFIQADAMTFDLSGFDFIWASPPCQLFSKSKGLVTKDYKDLIEPIRKRLIATGKPYIIENVPGAPLINPLRLNGQLFDLMVDRERWFECSFPAPFLLLPPRRKAVKMGRPVKEGDVIQVVGHFSNVPYARKAMGIEWMTQKELAAAIPPAYSKFLGLQVFNLL